MLNSFPRFVEYHVYLGGGFAATVQFNTTPAVSLNISTTLLTCGLSEESKTYLAISATKHFIPAESKRNDAVNNCVAVAEVVRA